MTDLQTIPEPQIEVKPEPKKTVKKKAAPKRKTKRKRKRKSTPRKKPAAKTQGKGRPKGSTSQKKPQSVGILPRCKKCGSTQRERYTNPRSIKQSGIDPSGKPYNQVTWRNTRCKKCKQARIDKFYEFIDEKT